MDIKITPSTCKQINFIDLTRLDHDYSHEIDLTDDDMQKIIDMFTAYLKDKDNK